MATGAITGALAALVDTIDAALSGFDGQLGFYACYALSALTLVLGIIGALLGLWAQGAAWLGSGVSGRAGHVFELILVALPAAAFVAWVPTSWIVEHWRAIGPSGRAVTAAVYAAIAVGSVTLAEISLRIARSYDNAAPALPRLHPLWLGASGVLATASYVADRWVLVGLYEDFHYGLSAAFFASLGCFWILTAKTAVTLRPSLRRRARKLASPIVVAAGMVVACGLLAGMERLSPDVFASGQSPLFPKFLRTVRASTDFDGDGLSSLFGGSDCAPFNPSIRPGTFDMPGNRIDEDCTGRDARWPKLKPTKKYSVPNLEGYNVLLITVDALRADHVGAYGYTRNPTTPNLDRLAKRSIRFAEAFAAAPKTLRSLPALATGLYPSNIPRAQRAIRRAPNGEKIRTPLGSDAKLMAEVLKARGYQTLGVHGISLRKLGLDRGFDQYVASREATATMVRFLNTRAQKNESAPFFAWLHYYSPHHTYEKREGFDFGDEDFERYDSEIAFDDHQMGILFERLDALALRDRTIIFVTADHGEEFRDHGGTQHGFRLYRELTHVPLIVFLPGAAPSVVKTPVELVDVFPTVCDALGITKSCPEHDGQSLLAARAGKRPARRGAYNEIHTRGDLPVMNALFDGRWRIIYDYVRDRAELYDGKNDHAEKHNVAGAHPDLVRTFRDRLAMRPIERQAALIGDYLNTKNEADLIAALPRLRHERLLKFVLNKLSPEMKPAYVGALRELRRRPNISRELRKTIDGLIKRGKHRSRR